MKNVKKILTTSNENGYEILKDDLISIFQSKQDEIITVEALFNRKQLANESINDFSESIKTIAKKVFQSTDGVDQDKNNQTSFYK